MSHFVIQIAKDLIADFFYSQPNHNALINYMKRNCPPLAMFQLYIQLKLMVST